MPARRPSQATFLLPIIAVLAALPVSSGCRGRAAQRWWPAPDRVMRRGQDVYIGYDFDRNGRLDYLQRARDGYIDRLYFPVSADAPPIEVVPRPANDPSSRPLLILLLDGVAYDRVESLWRKGHLRLFRRPARVISTFPTLTDVAYDAFFRTGPTPGYEAGYYDRAAGRLTDGVRVYLSGGNERWIRHCDYRMSFILDAVMYLFPKYVFRSELRRAREVLDELLARGRSVVVLYILSTDGLGHMLAPREIERKLIELDGWLEKTIYDWRGGLEIVLLADHGNSTTPPERFHLRRLLRQEGFSVVERLRRPGEVAVPLFGLLDVARVHTFDDATRDRAVEVLSGRPEVELLAWRDGDQVGLQTASGRARIASRESGNERLFRYESITGDPLQLAAACRAMRAGGAMDDAGFADADAWLAATADHAFPVAVPRLWDGLQQLSAERPDLVLSLADGYFVGSGFLAGFVKMRGTHGGLHRRAGQTFAMSTSCEFPSPIQLENVLAVLRERLDWEPQER